MKVAYITGCAGFIGSHITEYFLARNWIIRGIDKMTYASDEAIIQEFEKKYENFYFEKKDINDIDHIPIVTGKQ